jgi:hypothetical protein
MPEHRLICPISKNSSPDAHFEMNGDRYRLAQSRVRKAG